MRNKIVLLAVILMISTAGIAAFPQSPPERPLPQAEVDALIAMIKRGTLEHFDEDVATAIAEKWDAHEDLAGRTRLQILKVLFADLKPFMDAAGYDQKQRDSVWGLWTGQARQDEETSAAPSKAPEISNAKQVFSAPNFTILERDVGKVAILDLKGRFLESGAPDKAVFNAIRTAIMDGKGPILVNLADVVEIEKPGFDEMLRSAALARGQNTRVIWFSISNNVQEALDVEGYTSSFFLAADERSALVMANN